MNRSDIKNVEPEIISNLFNAMDFEKFFEVNNPYRERVGSIAKVETSPLETFKKES